MPGVREEISAAVPVMPAEKGREELRRKNKKSVRTGHNGRPWRCWIPKKIESEVSGLFWKTNFYDCLVRIDIDLERTSYSKILLLCMYMKDACI